MIRRKKDGLYRTMKLTEKETIKDRFLEAL